ncbi:MAG: DUF465 domain-containing protein [Candidatus Aminicenantes bacterium]|nr:DUF465 domain-containing protein [Candidatus Aminicenantes bacterium]
MKENELKERLIKENEEFRKLYEQHQEYEKRIDELLARVGLDSQEELEIKKLKKLKLKLKDKMQEILLREMEKRGDS